MNLLLLFSHTSTVIHPCAIQVSNACINVNDIVASFVEQHIEVVDPEFTNISIPFSLLGLNQVPSSTSGTNKMKGFLSCALGNEVNVDPSIEIANGCEKNGLANDNLPDSGAMFTSMPTNNDKNTKESSPKTWSSLFTNIPCNVGVYTPRTFEIKCVDGVMIPHDEVIEVGSLFWKDQLIGFFLDENLS